MARLKGFRQLVFVVFNMRTYIKRIGLEIYILYYVKVIEKVYVVSVASRREYLFSSLNCAFQLANESINSMRILIVF